MLRDLPSPLSVTGLRKWFDAHSCNIGNKNKLDMPSFRLWLVANKIQMVRDAEIVVTGRFWSRR